MRKALAISLIIAIVPSLYIHLDLAAAQFPFAPSQNEANNNNNTATRSSGIDNTKESNRQNNITTLSTYEDTVWHFKLSYPSNLTKYPLGTLNLGTTTGHRPITNVDVGLPSKNQTFFTIAAAMEPGNFLL